MVPIFRDIYMAANAGIPSYLTGSPSPITISRYAYYETLMEESATWPVQIKL
jgi:hypothetical protein